MLATRKRLRRSMTGRRACSPRKRTGLVHSGRIPIGFELACKHSPALVKGHRFGRGHYKGHRRNYKRKRYKESHPTSSSHPDRAPRPPGPGRGLGPRRKPQHKPKRRLLLSTNVASCPPFTCHRPREFSLSLSLSCQASCLRPQGVYGIDADLLRVRPSVTAGFPVHPSPRAIRCMPLVCANLEP
ncbi:hypothetical protein HRbin09_01929 [bacterium HR09]|nr:hypothetical protein HRbin09_01929 [bacterium HR09]